jgi:hypothetical protein
MNYSTNITFIQKLYSNLGLSNQFRADDAYLSKAFADIDKLWHANFGKVEEVKYIMIAEAPLWGNNQNYIYNPSTKFSQFFYKSDLEDVLNKQIKDKQDFLDVCNSIGLVVVDISPFALNSKNTRINYSKNENLSKKLSTAQYKLLVEASIDTYFDLKIQAIAQKKAKKGVKVFFRYARVKNNFQAIVTTVLIKNKVIKSGATIGDISQNGGGMDKTKLKKIVP